MAKSIGGPRLARRPGDRPAAPDRGDLVWLTFEPRVGHEQGGRRPALVLSPARYNGRVGLLIACSITSKVKGYAWEVALPTGLPIGGVVLADQVRSLDWHGRQLTPAGRAPADVVEEVGAKLVTLLPLGNG